MRYAEMSTEEQAIWRALSETRNILRLHMQHAKTAPWPAVTPDELCKEFLDDPEKGAFRIS